LHIFRCGKERSGFTIRFEGSSIWELSGVGRATIKEIVNGRCERRVTFGEGEKERVENEEE